MPRLVDQSPEELKWAHAELAGTRVQVMLHNFLLRRVEEYRSRLETAPPDEVMGLQTAIRETRTLLGEIHAHDTDAVKRIYQ